MSASVGFFSIGGIASGLDTDTMIEQLMQLERQPVVQMQNTQTQLRQVDDAWGRVNTKLSSLRTAVDAMAEPGRFSRLVSVTSSDSDAVAAAPNGSSGAGSVSFTVTQLAQSHQLASAGFASADAVLDAGELSVTSGETTTTVTLDGTQTLTDLAAELDDADGGFSASVVKVADGQHRLILTGDDTGAASTLTVAGAAAGQLGALTTLRQAQDAQLELGTDTTMTVTRASNTIDDLLPGAAITLQQTTTAPVTVTSQRDLDGAITAVKSYVDALNGAIGTLADLSSYDATLEQGGVLQGDATARQLLYRLRGAVTAQVAGQTTGLHSGYQVGLSVDRDGVVTLDETKLRAALADDFDAVGQLFSGSATATDTGVGAVVGTADTAAGSYGVTITRPAEVARVTGSVYAPPVDGAPKTLRIRIGDDTVSVTIDATHTGAEQAALEIQAAIDSAELPGLRATATADGRLALETTEYGSAATFTVEELDLAGDVVDTLGLAGTHSGVDVAGTIGGEVASGRGRTLTADVGPAEGLSVTWTGAGPSTGGFSVSFTRGLAGGMGETLEPAEGGAGLIARARDGIESRIQLYQDRLDGYDVRLATRESTLRKQFTAMEVALSQLQAQGSWLTSQLSGLDAQLRQ